MPAERENGSGVRALSRGLNILRCFDTEHRELGLIEMSRMVGLHKTTTLRLVKTLESANFLALDQASGKYHLGRSMFLAVYLLQLPAELVRVAHPHMQRLANETGESIVLSVWTEEGPLCAHMVLTPRRFKPPVDTGLVFTDLANASSKIFLAFGPEKRRAAALRGSLPKLTEYTIVDLRKMALELDRVRREGVAYDLQEYRLETCAVAAPVHDSVGEVRMALALVAPVERSTSSNMSRYAESVKKAATALSRELQPQGINTLP
jgi:DNA-binding IclR family transcriptional regulator